MGNFGSPNEGRHDGWLSPRIGEVQNLHEGVLANVERYVRVPRRGAAAANLNSHPRLSPSTGERRVS